MAWLLCGHNHASWPLDWCCNGTCAIDALNRRRYQGDLRTARDGGGRTCVISPEARVGLVKSWPPELFVSLCFSEIEALFKFLYSIVMERFNFHDVDLLGTNFGINRVHFRLL
jgi:hypothetical protein